MKKLLFSLFAGSVVLSSSCVSSSKFKKVESQNQQLQTDLSSCNTNLSAANSSLETMNGKVNTLNAQVNNLTEENHALAREAEAYRKLKKDHQKDMERLESGLAEQGTSLEEIREKLHEGFTELTDSGITVYIMEGFIHVTLPESILFKEGSASLGKNAPKALSSFAAVMNNYPRASIYVVGHTDSKSISNASFKDNWSLSTERANSIVRVLRDKYQIDPVRLLAAGRSKYSPVATNETREGRATNRRTEFIIDPNIRTLFIESMVE
ncbi:OmpA/MotB family protein [Pollutibacter soli]|uniref:OmpA/MotB family protein n=1 Tax=Pollutibacter soli TaxID=3034157 RepID=UPI00301404B2